MIEEIPEKKRDRGKKRAGVDCVWGLRPWMSFFRPLENHRFCCTSFNYVWPRTLIRELRRHCWCDRVPMLVAKTFMTHFPPLFFSISRIYAHSWSLSFRFFAVSRFLCPRVGWLCLLAQIQQFPLSKSFFFLSVFYNRDDPYLKVREREILHQ